MSRLFSLIGDNNGAMVIEGVVAISIFVAVLSVSLMGISTVFRAGARIEQQGIAENVARNQMEWAFNQTYGSTYAATTTPGGYGASISTQSVDYTDSNVQRITVVVTNNGLELLTLETIRSRQVED